MKPWVYGKNGRLCVDTKHPEWIKYFIDFVTKIHRRQRYKLIKANGLEGPGAWIVFKMPSRKFIGFTRMIE